MTEPAGVALDRVKLFAMNAQLTEATLNRIEGELNVNLGRGRGEVADKDDDYYPQFEEAVRAEAAAMAAHYEVFYCLEKTIRQLISETLQAAHGAQWWDKARIPQVIKDEVGKRMQKEVDSAVTLRSTAPLDFTTFGELGEIIKSSWDLFGGILNSSRAVEKVMANLNTLRGPIAHCTALAEDEVLRLQLSMRDWFRLMQ